MKYSYLLCLLLPLHAETLHYTINWPSGLSLGEASLHSETARDPAATKGGGAWSFDLDVDAGVPGFAIRDQYHSKSSLEFCSTELEKNVSRGSRKSKETDKFNAETNMVSRATLPDGGKSEFPVPACAKDALTFLQFSRRELAQGRLAPQQPVILGGAYQVRLEFMGTQSIHLGPEIVQADRIQATIKGSSGDLTGELFFSRDSARTPLLIRIPLALGTFTAELMR